MEIDELYNKLFIKAQGKGMFHTFTFDIKNSKEMDKDQRFLAQYQIIELIERIYFDLKELENILDRKILLNEPGYGNIFNHEIKNDFAFRYDPFVIGDTVGLTIYSKSIPYDIVIYLFEMNKEELGINFEFHIAHGDYETDDYNLGDKMSFRGDIIKILSTLHKPDSKVKLTHERILEEDELEIYKKLIEPTHEQAVINAENYTYGDHQVKKLTL